MDGVFLRQGFAPRLLAVLRPRTLVDGGHERFHALRLAVAVHVHDHEFAGALAQIIAEIEDRADHGERAPLHALAVFLERESDLIVHVGDHALGPGLVLVFARARAWDL